MAEKLTPEEIKKALECCIEPPEQCDDCPLGGKVGCQSKSMESALDLINRQQAEIEKLKYNCGCRLKNVKATKSEAIKEFAERLRKCMGTDTRYILISEFTLNNLVKEMVGDDK